MITSTHWEQRCVTAAAASKTSGMGVCVCVCVFGRWRKERGCKGGALGIGRGGGGEEGREDQVVGRRGGRGAEEGEGGDRANKTARGWTEKDGEQGGS